MHGTPVTLPHRGHTGEGMEMFPQVGLETRFEHVGLGITTLWRYGTGLQDAGGIFGAAGEVASPPPPNL